MNIVCLFPDNIIADNKNLSYMNGNIMVIRNDPSVTEIIYSYRKWNLPGQYEYFFEYGSKNSFLIRKKQRECEYSMFIPDENMLINFGGNPYSPQIYYHIFIRNEKTGVFYVLKNNEKELWTLSRTNFREVDGIDRTSYSKSVDCVIYQTDIPYQLEKKVFSAENTIIILKSGKIAEISPDCRTATLYDPDMLFAGKSAEESKILDIKPDLPGKIQYMVETCDNSEIINIHWYSPKSTDSMKTVFLFAYVDYSRRKLVYIQYDDSVIQRDNCYLIYHKKTGLFYQIDDGKIFLLVKSGEKKQVFPGLSGDFVRNLMINANRITDRYLWGVCGSSAVLVDLCKQKYTYVVFSDKYDFVYNRIIHMNAFSAITTGNDNNRTIYFMLTGDIFPHNMEEMMYLPEECKKAIYHTYIIYCMRKRYPITIRILPKDIFHIIIQKYIELFYRVVGKKL